MAFLPDSFVYDTAATGHTSYTHVVTKLEMHHKTWQRCTAGNHDMYKYTYCWPSREVWTYCWRNGELEDSEKYASQRG